MVQELRMGRQERVDGAQALCKTVHVTLVLSITYIRYLNRFNRPLWLAPDYPALIFSQPPLLLPTPAKIAARGMSCSGLVVDL